MDKSGSSPEELIADMIGDDDTGLSSTIVDILHQEENYDVIKDGDTPSYQSDWRYDWNGAVTHPYELLSQWGDFSARVRHGRRFFDAVSEQYLAGLVELIRKQAQWLGVAHDFQIGRGTKLYRARQALNRKQAQSFLDEPARELGPPPPEYRNRGRMNAAGISVFYGAFDPQTCLAELRPNVGALVAIGEFRVLRSLKLLDLSVFRSSPPRDLMEAGYLERATNHDFLRRLDQLISQPIQPHEEELRYVPTQIFAEYLANVAGYDGIVYASAQAGRRRDSREEHEGRGRRNIALFHAGGILKISKKDQAAVSEDSFDPLSQQNRAFVETKPRSLRCNRKASHVVQVTGVDIRKQRTWMEPALKSWERPEPGEELDYDF